MADIQTFIDEVITVIRGLAAVKMVPDDPTEGVPEWPFSPVFLVDGRSKIGPPELVTYHDTVTVGLLAPSQDMALKNQVILPQKEVVVEALFQALKDGSFSVKGFSDIEYVYGPIEWAGLDMFGFLFTIRDVKTQRTLT